MRVSCWIDELPPPNGSDPVHEGDTVSKDKGILFPLGLLACLPARWYRLRDLGHSTPWVNQVYLRSRGEQEGQEGAGVGSCSARPETVCASQGSPCTSPQFSPQVTVFPTLPTPHCLLFRVVFRQPSLEKALSCASYSVQPR